MNHDKNSFENDIATGERLILVVSVLGMASALGVIVNTLMGI